MALWPRVTAAEPLPDDVETLKAMLLAERRAYGAKVRDRALVDRAAEAPDRPASARTVRPIGGAARVARPARVLQLFELEEAQAQAESSGRGSRAPERDHQCRRSSGASRRVGRCPSICRASA